MASLPVEFFRWLQAYAPRCRYWVAYSGGVDSHALLHALSSVRDALPAGFGAVHIDHGLQSESPAWERRCGQVCNQWGVSYTSLQVDANPDSGESPEAAARRARYAALQSWLPEGDCLLTAHHQDDQAETLLLQLLRGSGPRGLSGIHALAPFGKGLLARPFLQFTQSEILSYARAEQLEWIDDPSNAEHRYDRNFLRARVLPLLQERWPGLPGVLTRAARLQSDAARLLDDLGGIDLQAVCHDTQTLSVSATLCLTAARQRNVLRYWLPGLDLSVPSAAVLERMRIEVLGAAPDAEPVVCWNGGEVRRYRDALYAFTALPFHDNDQVLDWTGGGALELASAGGILRRGETVGRGVSASIAAQPLQIRFRQGGESVRRAGHAHHHPLKKLFQELGLPPWERSRVPLIYRDDELVAVAGLWVSEGFHAAPNEPGVDFFWSRLESFHSGQK